MFRSIIITLAILLSGSIANGQTLTLESPGPTNNNNRGVMFDVNATNAVAITGFDIALYKAFSNNPVDIYTRTGTHVGFETNASAWTLAGTANVTGAAGSVVNVPIALNIALQAGDIQAFYIYQPISGGFAYRDSTSVGSPLVDDSNINLLVGTGIADGIFERKTPNRAFVGSIHYSLIAPPQPTSTTPVPTLGIFGLMGLAGAIGAAGVAMTRRRKQ